MRIQLGTYPFVHLCRIEPDCDENGRLRRFELTDEAGKRMWGGPFCRFLVEPEISLPAVYALTVSGKPMYVGQTTNLAQRFGRRGYGEARPPGGPDDQGDTNRRINHLIFKACTDGKQVDLYYLVAYDRLDVENELLGLQLPWNVAGPKARAVKSWNDALRASGRAAQLLLRDRRAGEAQFISILRAHSSDGMVYMNRAQAYEQIGELQRAALDYARAEVLVPYSGRKAAAREGLRRCGF